MRLSIYLSQQLEDLRIDKNTASSLFGVSRQSLHKWLTNKSLPSFNNLKSISRVLALLRGIPLSDVLDEMTQSIKKELSQ